MKETMKWLRVSLALLVAVVMSCGLAACGDDDDDDDNGGGGAGGGIDKALVGTWRSADADDDTNGYEIEFKADGTVIDREIDHGKTYTDRGRWSAKGNILTIVWPDEEEPYVCKYSVSGNTLKKWYYDETTGEYEDEPDVFTRVK